MVHTDGTISCWGPGHEGQLGLGNTETRHLPVAVPGITDAVAVAVGSGFACVAHRDGGVSCWGRSWYGQLGVRMEEPNRSTPERVPELADVVAISAHDRDHQDDSVSFHHVPLFRWGMLEASHDRLATAGLIIAGCTVNYQCCNSWTVNN